MGLVISEITDRNDQDYWGHEYAKEHIPVTMADFCRTVIGTAAIYVGWFILQKQARQDYCVVIAFKDETAITVCSIKDLKGFEEWLYNPTFGISWETEGF